MTEYIPRLIDRNLTDYMRELPAIALEGPKGVGKTATGRQRAATVITLDVPEKAEAFQGQVSRLATDAAPIFIDEWQRIPWVWNHIRHSVDDGAEPGRFLLAGSAAPRGADIHTGAGRIVRMRMRPLSLAERPGFTPTVSLGGFFAGGIDRVEGASAHTTADYAAEIASTGFPGIRKFSPRIRRQMVRAYIDSIIEREFPLQGVTVRRPAVLKAWMSSYAAAVATTASYTAILDAATSGESDKPTRATTTVYRDVLHSLWMLDEVPPWNPGGLVSSRLTQSPKHYLADPGLAAELLSLDEDRIADGAMESRFGPQYGGITGRLFEALVALNLQTYAAHNEADVGYLRTHDGGREIDFIVQKGRRCVAIEVKLTPSVTDHDVRHLHWLKGNLGDTLAASLVITTGSEAYTRRDGVHVVPASILGP
jgi:predicted AAA+ superfamily ATPase